ncbi:MAG: hypothetical protein MO846_07985 [Candidatus Devosia symbiotica]|nr:hypothetical protein [Candidatus Devosia symbiotica]
MLFAAYGFAANPIYAVAVAHTNDYAKDGEFTKIARGMLLILGIGPIVSSLIMHAWSPVELFLVTAAFHGALVGTAFLHMRIRKSVDIADRAPLQPMDNDWQVTPEGLALDLCAELDDVEMRVDEQPAPEELADLNDEENPDV